MTLQRPLAAVLMVVAALLSGGCALTSRGRSLDIRWYTPEQARESPGPAELQGTCPLQLRRVTSGADLGTRIAFGDGMYRVGYHEELRWTERPDRYLRRALERRLFEDGVFQRTTTGPTLDVELLDFKEVKSPAIHSARVAVRVVLSSDADQLNRTVVVSRPVAGERFDDFVAAMASALQKTSDEVADFASGAARCR